MNDNTWPAGLPPAAPEAGTVAGRYVLGAEIARGGMGAVYRATDTELGREVAVKVLRQRGTASSAARRFADEARITAQLQHPAIPPVHDLGTLPDGQPFLAMKLIEGNTLEALLDARSGPDDERGRFVAAFEQVCQAVAYAHARGIIHRDLKPGNIMVGAFGEVQVMDWGLAKRLDRPPAGAVRIAAAPAVAAEITTGPGQTTGHFGEGHEEGRTQAGQVMGTPAFMPPEQARGDVGLVGRRSDVFGLGAVLCAILTGQPPFTESARRSAWKQAAGGELGDAFSRLAGCGADEELVELCKRCLCPEPHGRPADGREVAELVGAYRAGQEERLRAAERQRAAAEAEAAEQAKRRGWQFALAGAVVLLLAGAGGFFWWQDRQRAERLQLEREKEAAELRLRLQEQERMAEGEARRKLEKEKEAAQLRLRLGEQEREAEAERRRTSDRAALGAHLLHCEKALKAANGRVAHAALAEAEKLAGAAGRAEEGRLARCRAELKVLALLDGADYYAWARPEGGIPPRHRQIAQWRDAFGRVGITDGATPAPEAAALVEKSLVRERLLAGLDLWFAMERSRWLRGVLAAADPDEFREAFRTALLAQDRARVAELAARPEAEKQPPRFAVAMGHAWSVPLARQRQVLERVLAAWPGNLRVLMALGDSYPSGQKEGLAQRLRWFQAAVSAHPYNAAAWACLGEALDEGGQLDTAIAAYREAVRRDGKLTFAQYRLAMALNQKGDLPGALEAFQKTAQLVPGSHEAQFNLGLARSKVGQADKALASFRESVRLSPDFARGHEGVGEILQRRRDWKGAEAAFRAAVRADNKLVTAHCNLASVLKSQGDLAGAIAAYREAVKAGPKFAPAHYNLAMALNENRDANGAIASYRDAARLDPALPNVHFNLGTLLARAGRFAEAAPCLEEAVRREPKNAQAHFNLAVLKANLGDLEGAVKWMREAARLAPGDAKVAAGLATALKALEKKRKKEGPAGGKP